MFSVLDLGLKRWLRLSLSPIYSHPAITAKHLKTKTEVYTKGRQGATFSWRAFFSFFALLGSWLLRELSLLAASGGYSLLAVCGLLITGASLVAEHK